MTEGLPEAGLSMRWLQCNAGQTTSGRMAPAGAGPAQPSLTTGRCMQQQAAVYKAVSTGLDGDGQELNTPHFLSPSPLSQAQT